MRITATLLLIGACLATYAGEDAMTTIVKTKTLEAAKKIANPYTKIAVNSDEANAAFSPILLMHLKKKNFEKTMGMFLENLHYSRQKYLGLVPQDNGMNFDQIRDRYAYDPEMIEVVAPFLGEDQKISLAEHFVLLDIVFEFERRAVDGVLPLAHWLEICGETGVDTTTWNFFMISGGNNYVTKTQWVLLRLFMLIADGDNVITREEYMKAFPETSAEYFNTLAQGNNEVTWPQWLAFYTGHSV